MKRTLATAAFSLAATAAPCATAQSGIADELSVVGTIRGAVDPGFQDTVLLLDVVAGTSHALTVGQCVPRLPDVCVRQIFDKTITVARGDQTYEVGRIEGAEPRTDLDPDAGESLAAPPPVGVEPMLQPQIGDHGDMLFPGGPMELPPH